MLLIGDAKSRRTRLLSEALVARGGRLRVIDWREILRIGGLPLDLRDLSSERWCKIDSPGDDPVISDALIANGWYVKDRTGIPPAPLRHGELAHTHLWFAGLKSLLDNVHDELLSRVPGLRFLNSVNDIITMGDKAACQQRLLAHDVNIPRLFGDVTDFVTFEARFPAEEHPRVFLKVRYGSSAVGVLALHRHRDGRMVAFTSTRITDDGDLFNHLRISRYTDRQTIVRLVDTLAVQGLYAETWIPKPRAPVSPGSTFDLRVVCFQGEVRQRIARLANSPLTNLHLGNERALPEWLTPSQKTVLEETARKAAAVFSDSASIGFDMIVRHKDAVIIEANAFGDLLPEVRHQGATTYDDQAAWVCR